MKMNNLKRLGLLFCLVAVTGSLSAQSELGPVYYLNDFTGSTLTDANTIAVTGSESSILTVEDGSLSMSMNDFKQYDVLADFELSLPLDLSGNATIMVRSKWENLEVDSAGGDAFSPSIGIFLTDEAGNKTGGDQVYWNICISPRKDEWSVGFIDLKKYPASVDFTQIKKIEFRYYDLQQIQSGKILFDYLYLGNIPSVLPVQTRTTFRNDYTGILINDDLQTTDVEKGGGTQIDGKFIIPVYSSYTAWNTYYGIALKTPVDMTGCEEVKMGIEIVNGVNGKGERNVNEEFSPRLIDAEGRRCVLNGSRMNGFTSGDLVLDFTNGYREDGDFDFTRVQEFRLMTGATDPGAGTIILDYLQLGRDVVSTRISYVSSDAEGVSIAANPPLPGLLKEEVSLYAGEEPVPVTGISTNDEGASYRISASLSAQQHFLLNILKDGIYANKLYFNLGGAVEVIVPQIKRTDAGLIRVFFDKKVDLEAGNFSLTDKMNGTTIGITKVTPIYEGLAYDVECGLTAGVSALLSVTKEGYLFGDPLFVRVAKNPALVSVDWTRTVASVTDRHWGVNDYAAADQKTFDKFHVDYLNKIRPGLIRIHRAGLVDMWTDRSTRDWNKEVIRQVLTNAQQGYGHSELLLCIDEWPSWLHDGAPLPKDKEAELIDLAVKLPGVIRELGFHVDYYEFLNEKDNPYQNAGRIGDLWNLLKRMAVAIKQAYPEVKVGGPALTWPNSEWYKPFLDVCGENIDFISWHNYASGSPETTNEELFANSLDLIGTDYPKGVMDYLKSKGWENRIETFLDEFNVQWTWTPYEPRHHNHVGASWMALLIKRLAVSGISGATVWNSKDGAYGLLPGDYYSAPANLYIWGQNFLRGGLAESTDDEAGRIELFPVVTKEGKKSLLMINKSGEEATVLDVYKLMGVTDGSALNALVLDETTCLGDKKYTTRPLESIDNDLVVQPCGMILVTTIEAAAVTAPEELDAVYVLHDAIKLAWKNDDVSRRGFRIWVNGRLFGDVTDTCAVIGNLQPATGYKIDVMTLDEFYHGTAQVTTSIERETLPVPLIVNDRTTGSALHQMNYDDGWFYKSDKRAYNSDYTVVSQGKASVVMPFEGYRIVLFGYSGNRSGKLNVYIDDELQAVVAPEKSDKPFDLIYYGDLLEDSRHLLRIESVDDTETGLDKIYIYGSRFEQVTEKPSAVTDIRPVVTFSTISLEWTAPDCVSGIQYYTVSMDETADTVVYSPSVIWEGVKPETTYRFVIRAYDPCGNYSETNPFDITSAQKVMTEVYRKPDGATVSIDGNADEVAWSQVPALLITNNAEGVCDDTDLSASFRMMWDKNYLYILLQITDDVKTTAAEGSAIRENDGFELFLDGNNKKAGHYSKTDVWYQYQHSPFLLTEFYNQNPWLSAATMETEEGYCVEMRYKWTGIGMYGVGEGKELGMDIHVNDNDRPDEPGLDHKLTWQLNSMNAGSNTALLGNVVLAGMWSGVKSTRILPLTIYPNPVEDECRLQMPEKIFTVKVIDIAGAKVISQENNPVLSMEGLPRGIYTVQVKTPNEMYAAKLIRK